MKVLSEAVGASPSNPSQIQRNGREIPQCFLGRQQKNQNPKYRSRRKMET